MRLHARPCGLIHWPAGKSSSNPLGHHPTSHPRRGPTSLLPFAYNGYMKPFSLGQWPSGIKAPVEAPFITSRLRVWIFNLSDSRRMTLTGLLPHLPCNTLSCLSYHINSLYFYRERLYHLSCRSLFSRKLWVFHLTSSVNSRTGASQVLPAPSALSW